MTPGPPADAGRAVLDAADSLFYSRGIADVGMDDIRDAAGVSLRRLYSLYPSKRDLVAGWLHDRHERWMAWFSAAVERRAGDGTEALVAVFDALDEWAATPGYRGCAFLNSIAETSEIDAGHRAIVAEHKRALVAHLGTLATRDHPDAPAWLPAAIAVLLDGAIVQTAVFGDRFPTAAARAAALHLVESR
jgi:AcrR family transcriptional regulator